MPCPHCQRTGTLNRHSLLFGNDPDATAGRCERGQRAYCSRRGRRGGCGRSFSFFFAGVLPRHTVSAAWLWRLLVAWLPGLSLQGAVESLAWPLALETAYAVVRRVRGRLTVVRERLCRVLAAPASTQTEPVLQSVEHLQRVFPGGAGAVEGFQLQFQAPFMG